jgi:hypothetical protein
MQMLARRAFLFFQKTIAMGTRLGLLERDNNYPKV